MTEKRFKLSRVALNNPNAIRDNKEPLTQKEVVDLLNELSDENEQLKKQKQQYKGQRDYLLFVIERRCSKELFEETKSYLKGDVE